MQQRRIKDGPKQSGTTPSRFRPWLVTGVLLGACVTLLGLLAGWFPVLDLVNDFLPATVAAAFVLVALCSFAHERSLIIYAAFIATINVAMALNAWDSRAPGAPTGAERFFRIVTFNLWYENDRIDDVAKFLAGTDADAIVLQEVTPEHWQALKPALEARYPNRLGDAGLMLLSKYPILTQGRIDRGGGRWATPIVRWAKIDVHGKTIDVAGVHFARPTHPSLQSTDIAAITAFARRREAPLILAGDFNLTPWTQTLTRFAQATGLSRYNSFNVTWPMRRQSIPLVPLFAIDNVFASSEFAEIATEGGPRLGSDHRPVIADIALVAPAAAKASSGKVGTDSDR